LDSTVLRWPSSLLIVLWGKEAASQQRPQRTRPAADQVMTLLLQLVLGQLYGVEKSPQQLAHTPAHQPPPARRPGPVFFNCSNISKSLRRCLSVPPAHHTHHTASHAAPDWILGGWVVLENKVCYHNYITPANERGPDRKNPV
jgi:hypothetical protein